MCSRWIPLIASTVLCIVHTESRAHCEIPCGIYGDELRFSMIDEDVRTIEKAMVMIGELEVNGQTGNQLVRWITNKEEHADRIREIVTQYFMTQRLQVPDGVDETAYVAYIEQLVLLHKMLLVAMKCKQTIDTTHTKTLHDLLHGFRQVYGKYRSQ